MSEKIFGKYNSVIGKLFTFYYKPVILRSRIGLPHDIKHPNDRPCNYQHYTNGLLKTVTHSFFQFVKLILVKLVLKAGRVITTSVTSSLSIRNTGDRGRMHVISAPRLMQK